MFFTVRCGVAHKRLPKSTSTTLGSRFRIPLGSPCETSGTIVAALGDWAHFRSPQIMFFAVRCAGTLFVALGDVFWRLFGRCLDVFREVFGRISEGTTRKDLA